ncbi:MAG: hypothetical protein IPK22_25405 [Verrucomicrobiaceae bacterium]|nr:hypothetical protein [Verrucomicrobiaceae bacterium]
MDETPAYAAAPAVEQPQAACQRCGKPEAWLLGEEWICDECYIACGSCCAGDEG